MRPFENSKSNEKFHQKPTKEKKGMEKKLVKAKLKKFIVILLVFVVLQSYFSCFFQFAVAVSETVIGEEESNSNDEVTIGEEQQNNNNDEVTVGDETSSDSNRRK